MPQTLTVLAPMRAGHEAPLRDLLRPIGDDIRGTKADTNRPRIEFTRSQRVHFARFAILPDPDRGPERSRLLYASTYDGTLDDHLAELIAITSDMDAIWSHCDGYTGVGSFGAFVRAHAHEPNAFYIAFRDQTVDSIGQAVTRSREDQGTSGGNPKGSGVGAAVQRFVRALPIVGDILRAIARCGFVNVFRSQLIVASLGRYWRFRVWNWLTGNRMPPRKTLYSSVAIDNLCRV